MKNQYEIDYQQGYDNANEEWLDRMDKIKSEIEHLTYYWCEINPKTVIDDVLRIIDKYKEESEDKDASSD